MEQKALNLKERFGTGSRRVMMLLALIMFIAAVPLFSAGAAGQTNPHREDVLRMERMSNMIGAKATRGAVYPINPEIVKIKEIQAPQLNGTGTWEITAQNGKLEVTSIACQITMKDENGYYNTIYFKSYNQNVSSFTSCTFVTGGSYRFEVYVDFTGDVAYSNVVEFTITESGVSALDQKIETVVRACKVSNDPWQTALNLHDWLTNNAYYDENYEYYGADGVLLRGKGVCDSYSRAYELLCKKAGIQVSRVTGAVNGYESHAWNAIQVDGEWYHVDVTWDDPLTGGENDPQSAISGHESHDYFCLNDELIGLDHENDGETFSTPCTSLNFNYYIINESWAELGNDIFIKEGSQITSYSERAAECVKSGETSFPLETEDCFYIISRVEDEITITTMLNKNTILLRWSLLAELMSRNAIESENGIQYRFGVTFDRSGKIFSFVLKGFDFEDTGTIKLPANIQTVEAEAFMGTHESTLIVPEGCTTIGSKAFANSGLHQVFLPDSVKTIANDAFEGDSPLAIVCKAGTYAAAFAEENGLLRIDPSAYAE